MKLYLAAILALILLVVFVNMSKKKPVNWQETFQLKGKNPYDLYVFNKEADRLFAHNSLKRVDSTVYEFLRAHPGNHTLFMIKPYMFEKIDSLVLSRIYEGSTLFINTNHVNSAYLDTLELKYTDVDPDLSLKKLDSLKLSLTANSWNNREFYLNPVSNSRAFVNMNRHTTTILGTMQMPDSFRYPSFVRVHFGKGDIYINCQPNVFTNYMLMNNPASADYVSQMLAYLPQGKPVYWFVNEQMMGQDTDDNGTELSVIFRYPALRAAWLIMLYGLILYVFFNAKRRQRIVPVIKPLRNTTVEFVQTISNLYFQEGSTSNLMGKKINYFLDKIRSKYMLNTNVLDDNFAEMLHLKSGRDRELINNLIYLIANYRKLGTAAPSDLLHLNKLIEEFGITNL